MEGLTKKYGQLTALDHLELTLEGSKCVGFLGPNGAGKTTALKLLSDMIFPTEGECFINGISVQEERKKALAEVGLLIETPEIYPSLTPREALGMIADLRGVPHSEWNTRIETVLSEVKMLEWADKKVGSFSKGMKQRINIAASLIHDPEIVILDEPATGLDPRGMAEVRDIVRSLKKRNRLIFMSSHILQEVTDVCDEIALIDKGKLILYDTLANTIARFSDAGAQSTVDAGLSRPLDSQGEEKLKTSRDIVSFESVEPNRLRITFKGGLKGQERLLQSLVAMDIGIISLSGRSNALEDIYLQQIGRGD